jgi:hypothetical protein
MGSYRKLISLTLVLASSNGFFFIALETGEELTL